MEGLDVIVTIGQTPMCHERHKHHSETNNFQNIHLLKRDN